MSNNQNKQQQIKDIVTSVMSELEDFDINKISFDIGKNANRFKFDVTIKKDEVVTINEEELKKLY
jgi:hypothetical protein